VVLAFIALVLAKVVTLAVPIAYKNAVDYLTGVDPNSGAEAGNTFVDLPSADLFNLKKSAGVGARILINPIGLIGFDYGYGFDRLSVDGQDPKWEFHFQFGRGF
jgi:hypothetical protein